MKFKQMTSLVALSFLFLSAEAFAGKDDPIEGENKGGSGKVTATSKSQVKTTDREEKGTPPSDNKPVLLEQNSAVVVEDMLSGSAAADTSRFGDLTQSVYGHVTAASHDTRGYGLEWWAPRVVGTQSTGW